VLSNMPDKAHRRLWIQRILDHDGVDGSEGGIEAWLALAEAVGLTREEVLSLDKVAPGVRFAVDAYVNFARKAPWQEAVCSSLTELFAPTIHQKRLDSWPSITRGLIHTVTGISDNACQRHVVMLNTVCA